MSGSSIFSTSGATSDNGKKREKKEGNSSQQMITLYFQINRHISFKKFWLYFQINRHIV
jgi:hypothetical protein